MLGGRNFWSNMSHPSDLFYLFFIYFDVLLSASLYISSMTFKLKCNCDNRYCTVVMYCFFSFMYKLKFS